MRRASHNHYDDQAGTATERHAGAISNSIQSARRWLRSGWVATGAGISVGLAALLLLATGVIDLVFVLWPLFRLVALLTIVVPIFFAVAWGVVNPLFRRLTDRTVARRIEARLPAIHNRLISCVDLEPTSVSQPISASFHRKLLTEASERIAGFDPKTLLDREHLRRAAIFAGMSVLAFLVGMQVFSDRLPTALARIFSPFADIPPASGVRYIVEPGNHKMLRGEEVEFEVKISEGNPNDLTLEIDVTEGKDQGKSLQYGLTEQNDSTWTFRLSGFASSFVYRIRGGGTWSPLYHVTMLDRPQIVGLQTKLIYPSYMGETPIQVGPPDVADVVGPVGSTIHIEVNVEGDPTQGQIQLLQKRTISVPLVSRPERTWLATGIPDGALAEGTWNWIDDHHGRLAHQHSSADGVTFHRFVNAPLGFRVKPDEVLFADVFLDRDNPPVAIMLQFQDGTSWEHRAYWGEDVFTMGATGSASRYCVGKLPAPGRWMRLEVPASQLDLEGHSLHGISFTQFGGSAWWGSAGTMPPAETQIDELVMTDAFPLMRLASSNDAPALTKALQMWSGTFPLTQSGWYRVVLQNEVGTPNPTMKEATLTAIPDRPPQVIVERPGVDLILSAPQKVPLSIAAFDDFGLAALTLAFQRNESGDFNTRRLREYLSNQKVDASLVVLDLVAEKLTEGDVFTYRVEARDCKGQTAQTQDFSIRIRKIPEAADQQLGAIENTEEDIRRQLAQLIDAQETVQRTLEQLEQQYNSLPQKLTAVEKPATQHSSPRELDDETKQQLADLQKELALLQQQEEQNAQAAHGLESSIAKVADDLSRQPLVPREIQQEMQRVADAFRDLAVEPIDDLNARLDAASRPETTTPQLGVLAEEGKQVARNLNALQDRMDAIAAAQQQSKDDFHAAMEQFQRELTRQNARLSANELANLTERIDEMREAMLDLLGDQKELIDVVDEAADADLDNVAQRQESLDPRIDDSLADTRRLLNSDEFRRLKQQQNSDSKDEESQDDNIQDNSESEFEPALGGPKPKVDPQFADEPSAPKEPMDDENRPPQNAAATKRTALGKRQRRHARSLSQAEQSLGSDQQTIEQLLENLERQLAEAARQSQQRSEKPQADESSELNEVGAPADDEPRSNLPFDEMLSQLTAKQAATLSELLSTPTMRQALAMAARNRRHTRDQRQRGSKQQRPAATQPQPGESPEGNLLGTLPGEQIMPMDLFDLEPGSRRVILEMKPAEREEILQGLRDQGPEGYREYIRDYFERLTKVKTESRTP